ncbi:MAG TPA: rhomboid family intramembrane serine protease [Xanthomonadales bacterium]|nr:rhomboid family intramembrane serine protease [Xanthomonadales bacterium]
MSIQQPDPRYTLSKRSKDNFSLALRISVAFTVFLWVIFLVDAFFGLRLGRFGLQPGAISGLIGIVTAPLFHASASHIFSNSLPLLLSLTAMLFLYPNSSLRAIPIIWLGSGIFAWFIGRPSFHFGASGLVYGLLAYVLLSGIIRRDMRSIAASLLIWFLYGTMVWGVLPIRPNMSWELHLGGALMGILAAIIFRNWDRPPMVRYEWEDDDTVPDWYPESKQLGKLDD